MSLSLIGLNYKTAPLDLRERLVFSEAESRTFLSGLIGKLDASEAFLLSTCGRIEILFESSDQSNEFQAALDSLSAAKRITPTEFKQHLYYLSEKNAARHLFRVAASLDSMVIGETQILGQVKTAYRTATEFGAVRHRLHKLLQSVLHAAKRVHTETRIAANAASLSKSAVELVRKNFNTLAGRKALLVGAGAMAKLAASHLNENNIGEILTVNRTFEAAEKLAAEFGGKAVELESLREILPRADIVICSTAAAEILIDEEMVNSSQATRLNRPALFIDLSVPRNVEPSVGEQCENVSLYSVDDLEEGSFSGKRRKEILRAERIINEEITEFWEKFEMPFLSEKSRRIEERIRRRGNSTEKYSGITQTPELVINIAGENKNERINI